jgi:hypothetical protein
VIELEFEVSRIIGWGFAALLSVLGLFLAGMYVDIRKRIKYVEETRVPREIFQRLETEMNQSLRDLREETKSNNAEMKTLLQAIAKEIHSTHSRIDTILLRIPPNALENSGSHR